MRFKHKNVPAKRNEMFTGEKKRFTKARSRYYKSEIPVRWENLISCKQILVFQ